MREELVIRPYGESDHEKLFAAYAAVVDEGGAFPRDPPATESMLREAWLDKAHIVRVAELGGRFAGSYTLKANFPGLAAGIANAGYLVPRELRRRGIGRALGEHSLEEARGLGYTAMMFNLVLERNPSRRLWESLGFETIGRIPNAVRGEAAFLYWRAL
jgi:GNAT superfamily N-acetyltransferase